MNMARNRIYFDGLSERQLELCDMLLECQSLEEVSFLLNYALTDEDKISALTLIEIMHLDAAEEDGGLNLVESLVEDMLNEVMNKSK